MSQPTPEQLQQLMAILRNRQGVTDPNANMIPGTTPDTPGARPVTREAVTADNWDGSYWDQNKLDAALKNQVAGGDGRKVAVGDTWMAALNPLYGLTSTGIQQYTGRNTPGVYSEASGSGEYYQGSQLVSGNDPIYGDSWKDKLGRIYRDAGKDADGNQLIQTAESWENPTGHHDRVQPTYKLDKNGNAVPVAPGTSYDGSEWVNNGRDVAKLVAIAAAAYFGGAGLAAADAGGGAAAGAAAADAGGGAAAGAAAGGATAQSSSTLAALYGNAGYGASTAAEAGFAGLGGTTAGGAAGLTASEVAAMEAGGGFAAGGGATAAVAPAASGTMPIGSGFEPTWSSVGEYAGDALGSGAGSIYDWGKDKLSDPDTYNKLIDAFTGGSGGSGGSSSVVQGPEWKSPDRSARIQAEALRKQANIAQQSYKPTWSA